MIRNNRLMFGYGTIGVRSGYNTIIFEEIDRALEIGSTGNDDSSINYCNFTSIIIEPCEYDNLFKELNSIHEKENKEILFKNYIFDFNNFNKISVDVVISALNRANLYNTLGLAC